MATSQPQEGRSGIVFCPGLPLVLVDWEIRQSEYGVLGGYKLDGV
jgi:hypothetical protein